MGTPVKRTSPRNQLQNASQPSTSSGRTRSSKIVSSSSSDDDSEDDFNPGTPYVSGSSRNTSTANGRGKNSTPEISQDEETNLIAECAFYMLVNDQKKYVIKKSDIIKNVLKEHRKRFKDIIEKAGKYLKRVVGVSLEEMSDHKGCYILVNEIKKARVLAFKNSNAEIPKYGLTMMVLAVIFMKKDLVYETEMWKALAKIGIDPDVKHPVLGEVKKFLTQELHKQMYIEYKRENTDPPAFAFSWGPRAKTEISKLDVLKFVCAVYGDMTAEEWPDQFNDAMGSDQSPEPER